MGNLIQTLEGGAIWAYRAVATENNAGGGTLTLDIEPTVGYLLLPKIIMVGRDNYGAARTISGYVYDKDGNDIYRFFSQGLDNQAIVVPTSGDLIAANNDGALHSPIRIQGPDLLKFQAGAVAQTETFTLAIRALIFGRKPTVTWSSSGTLGTVTTTYNEVL